MDYSELSDKEINKLVAFALGCKEVVPDIFMDDVRRYEFDKPKNKSGNKFYFDPCNSPADAWPIIVEHEISIIKDSGLHMWCSTDKAYWCDGCEWQISQEIMDANPLRAAMIVFLMMQESANVQDNPA
ncbi:DUF2591 domain-containing protein [Salmonella enterica]|nr:DUF2591 domain-containing protein [Salmonella enterica]ECL8012580.1 DUF2591 domain-containing protein [Salmonella enterica subsp. enterica]EDR6194310.1 DUF2591 domain-containing protein [Salmonella enterica subsp. enterica serovar Aqua]EAM8407044.1 DUF2591 domain-containing protein [Salmonella enterica]EAX1487339.1 DUF2591 domain-containing protein [Salmonella enterica]